ncbi:MAG: hypothetical protein JWQ21_516 [Herminiimonas sp.]|nr:hypothetical protein [Herminiimonas sp.]
MRETDHRSAAIHFHLDDEVVRHRVDHLDAVSLPRQPALFALVVHRHLVVEASGDLRKKLRQLFSRYSVMKLSTGCEPADL